VGDKERQVSSVMDRLNFFEKNSKKQPAPHSTKTSWKPQSLEMTKKRKNIESKVAKHTFGSATQSYENNDDHPSVVAIDDNFLVKDDTSGFDSASESSHRVVCQPSNRTPYYFKKHGNIEDSSVGSSLHQSISRWKNSDSKGGSTGFIAESTDRISNTVNGSSSVDVSLCNLQKNRGESESTKENSAYFRNQNGCALNRECKTNMQQTTQVRSSHVSSVSDRVAAFQRSSTGTKKWRPSHPKAANRKSTERLSHSKKRRSLRKSSLSLQDVLESRQQLEERRKSSICDNTEESQNIGMSLESDENVRPSDLFKKLAESVKPAPPSPLIYRRGFTTSAGRSSIDQQNKSKNLRCF
jgi:hypothetical protein